MNHGIPEKAVAAIQEVLATFPGVDKAVLYGSRAKGNFKHGSDIDLTLLGEGLDDRLLAQIDGALDDLLLPYKIDLSLYSQIHHAGLVDHIRRVGLPFYARSPVGAA